MVQEGRQIALGDYASDFSWRPPFTGTADVPAVLGQWEAGATIVLQALHVNWQPLAVFCRALEEALGYAVQANAYYTPRGSQGFAVHHDSHDVLILQVAGEKRWLLYDPLLELPLKHQRYTRDLGDEGEPGDDLVLQAGDTLYLPRGWLHQAETSDSDSLHLTIGIGMHTWVDAARGALDALEDDVTFRRGVEHGEADGLLDAVAAQLDPELVEQRMRRKFVQSRRPIREDGLSQLRALARPRRRHAARAAPDRDRRPRRVGRRRRRSSSRARRSPSPRTPRPRFGPASRARSRSGSATCPASSTRQAGSCSPAGSCARASSASPAERQPSARCRAGSDATQRCACCGLTESHVRNTGSSSTTSTTCTSWIASPGVRKRIRQPSSARVDPTCSRSPMPCSPSDSRSADSAACTGNG